VLSPNSRNLTDAQIKAVAAADGLVGINFEVTATRPDGALDADTPLTHIAAHVRHVANLAGVGHVALGSDFDGATMPAGLATARELPVLVDALRADGYTEDELGRICHGNWRRVLAGSW